MSVTRLRTTKTLLNEHGHEQNTFGAAAAAAATKSKSQHAAATTTTTTTNAANNIQQAGNSLATATKTKALFKTGITAGTTTTTTTTTATATAAVATTIITTNAPTTQQQQQQQQQQQLQQQQQQQTYLPQASLLKIEPFVPSFNSRSRPPHIYRSHSTLSSTQLKRSSLNNINATQTPPIEQQKPHHFVVGSAIDGLLPKATRTVARIRHQPRRNTLMRQRSKSNSSSASALPVASRRSSNHQVVGGENFARSNSPTTSVTQQPNGICRISRSPQDQEKLPDRINYDRRGLTAIPIFEHEPNLRLLSLQHNLINVFHIPKEQQEEEAHSKSPTEVDKPATEELSQSGRALLNGRSKLSQQQSTNGRASPHPHNAPSPAPANSSAQPLGLQSLSQMGPLSTHLPLTKSTLRGSSFLQRSALYSAQQQQLLQQQQSPQSRFNMKKSKSFVFNNSSRHLGGMRYNFPRSQLPERTESKLIATLSTTNLLSFDSGAGASVSTTTTDSNSTLAEDQAQQQEQLLVKNKQLVATYGQIFQNLVFLDLYDNQIERITNLDGLPMLSVLLLGKNRITDISGLSSLKSTLRVLDLHGNKITSLSNKINCLQELKSLNLAGNQIRIINNNDFCNLLNLKELNLKRNRIKRINGFQHLTVLERLWLCHNDLHKVEDMSTIAKALNLLEVTIENNPVSLAGDCVSFLVSYLPRLQSLSQMPITDQVRRAAMAWRKNKEHSDANYSHLSSDVFNSIRREEVISNARTNWELLRSQQTIQQGTQRQKRSPQQRELARINESNEANGSVEYEKMQDFLKLPPIQPPEQEVSRADGVECATESVLERQTGSSNSSLGPNIDSSSSCYSSGDNEAADSPTNKQAHSSYRHAGRTRSSKQPADVSNNHSNNQCQVKITTTPPDTREQNFELVSVANSKPNGMQAASQKPKDVVDNVPLLNDNNFSALSNSIAAATTPAEKPSSKQRVAALDKQPPRGATTTTPITANSNTLSLGFHNNNNNNGSAQPTPRTLATPTSNPKRYMQGSLMRSHTIVGGGGGGGGGSKATNASNKANLNQSQQNHQQNLSTNNVADQNRPANNSHHPQALACIIAPATTQATTTTTTTATTSKTNIINQTTSNTSAANTGISSKQVTEREREQGGDYLIEICGRYLNVYGQGALRYIDKLWNPLKANDVHTLNFSYINFNNIATILGRIKARFPHAENFVFRETNISCLGQLNALAELQGIASLCIDPEGNAITTKDLWRLYAVYRLSHWGLKLLNGVEVSEEEMEAANAMYAGLSDLVLWSMPEAMLQPLLARLRLDETCSASKLTPKEWLMKADKSLRIVVGKEALQWKKSTAGVATTNMAVSAGAGGAATSACAGHHQHSDGVSASCVVAGGTSSSSALNACCTTRERAKLHFATMMENTCNAVEKLHKLETLWPTLLQDIVRNTLLDYSQMDVYLRNLMAEIMK